MTLPSGDEMPHVGLGTWDLQGETVRQSVRAGLDAGYTHVDTAEGYKNEAEIGDVLAEYDREDLFLTSKVLPNNLHYDDVFDALEGSLDRLGVDYLDLYLVHWPNPAISLRETMHALGKLHDQGRVRNVGVSNFSVYMLRNAEWISDVPIAANQIEFHPWHKPMDVVEYCHENDIAVTAAAPLARTDLFADETLQDVAEAHDKSVAQVALRWEIQRGVVPIPKSSTAEHIAANLDVFDFELSDDELARIDAIDTERKVYQQEWDDPVYGIPQ
ncbi:MAG: aldo/keto reductase [Halobacteriaceae archaeon]